ncbi:AtpZ/AtpI family protein [Bacillus sp. FJAT-45350]|uniref:AtpZ/AtpI family protein n=1 Tax=Bacillus sp. FJAT-45350 TaxID=2011014 RepID=UPI000BB88D7E|nr:AtpZ/AtpI family protein [Bacillus sp. FJAT-45350]
MREKKPQAQLVRAMALMSTVLSYLVGPILVGVFGGQWLDSYFETKPIFLLIGLLLGIATGVYGLFRLLGEFLGEDDS